jgi:hypothetical protein
VRDDPQLAACVKVHEPARPLAVARAILETDILFGEQVGVQDAGSLQAIQVDERDRRSTAHPDGRLLDEDPSLQQDHALSFLWPGDDLVSVQEDGLRVAGHIALVAQGGELPGGR